MGAILVIVWVLSIIVSTYLAIWKCDSHSAEYKVMPFAWGYFLAYLSIASSLALILTALVIGFSDESAAPLVCLLILYSFLSMFLGTLGLDRNRWAHIAITFLTLNPIIWISNAIYLKNRWRELSNPLQKLTPDEKAETKRQREIRKGVKVIEVEGMVRHKKFGVEYYTKAKS